MQFRKDINGLRAIAVIGTVLFHAEIPWLPGGMAGVDIFFVISGFLMSSIIFTGIALNGFSTLTFYTARANKIIPPLGVLCFALLLLGWFLITPFEHKILIEHIVGSLGFFSNLIYIDELRVVDDMNAIPPSMWLLHTWSLSVEWQFYIIYPLILIIMHQFISMENIKKTLLCFTIISFIIGVITTYTDYFSAYHLLHTRVCGMLLGAIIYLYPMKLERNQQKIAEYLGLILIIATYLFYPGNYTYTPWPGYFVIFPLIGAFLMLQAQRNDSFITGNVLFQQIGTCSYSIYLWNLPIVFSVNYFKLNENFIYCAIPLSFFIGFLSHRYTQKMYFNTKGSFLCFLKSKPILIILLTLFCSMLMYQYNASDFNYSIIH